ncbi:secreted RxLR effector protein 161-like [Lathyrus oleraceus]|uniref:secreted RxLR effector protein 161-like n=1 Tax=Pisum sativum TaxID=3888 RepID=UPI0021CF2F55|nr:secreted RxLR effector protein 161-like [Pisum sativum]
MNELEITDLGNMTYFLGMEIIYSDMGLILHQLKYELKFLKRFELVNCKYAVTPSETNHKLECDSKDDDVDIIIFKQLVGCLRYLCNTKHDIFYAFGMMSKFINKSKWSHYQAAIRILRYIKGTLKYRVLFPSGVEYKSEMICYSDSDWCGDRVDKRSIFVYYFKYLGGPISWCSKKQPVVALTTCEAEYIAGVLSVRQVVWIMNLLQDLKIKLHLSLI